ncbi:MAG: segregation/condensation protein A [Armatimonadetes bacterium]|nr:segregation/condensation protein A [Armatimonadota bacterium]
MTDDGETMNFVQTEDSPYKVILGVFEGPLDLLLHLIREHEIDIYNIPIAQITEQYLGYLTMMEAMNLEVAGEWLVMAATLVEIKSRMLLPDEPKDEESDDEQLDPRLELVERLIEYEKFKSAAEIFKEREEHRAKIFGRGAVEHDFDLKLTFVLENITADDLLGALNKILSDVGDEPITSIQRRKITVRMRMREIQRKIIEAAGKMVFEDLFEDALTRVDVVMTFLALLELLKSRLVKVRQAKAFAPIQIIPMMETNG